MAAASARGTVRFGLIDSLRAIAALSIVGYHTLVFAGAAETGFTSGAMSQLIVGLTLFFVISGFVMYRPFVVALGRGDDNPDLRAYAWRRFLRIVPAYWAAVTVTGVLYASEVFERPVVFYGFLQNWSLTTNTQGVAVAFTLCLEVAFYATLPFYALAMRRAAPRFGHWRSEGVGLGLLLALGVAWQLGKNFTGIHAMEINTLPSVIDWFVVGMALAVASVWLEGRAGLPAAVRFVERAPWVCWGLALAVLALESEVLDRALLREPAFGGWGRMAVHYADVIVAGLLVLPAVFVGTGHGAIRRALGSRALVWLGLVSYGIYLWQLVVFHLLEEAGLRQDVDNPTLWWIPLGFGGAIAAGALSWYVIERPALSLRRLVPARRSSRPVEEAEASTVAVAP